MDLPGPYLVCDRSPMDKADGLGSKRRSWSGRWATWKNRSRRTKLGGLLHGPVPVWSPQCGDD